MRVLFLCVLVPMVAACQPLAPQAVSANTLIPRPVPSAPMSDWTDGVERTRVSFDTTGATLRGWTFAGPGRDGSHILFFNGNGMTVDASQALYRAIAATGATVTVFDYRGYGFSGGEADILQFRKDALALYDHMTQTTGKQMVVFGFSIGSAMASFIASQRPVKAVILAAPIARAGEEFPVYAHAIGYSAEQISQMKMAGDSYEAFDEVPLIARSTAPLLVLHGDADRLVPLAQGREMYDASPSTDKKFVVLAGATHNQAAGSTQSIQAVRQFLQTLAPHGK